MKEPLEKLGKSISSRRILAEIALGTVVLAVAYKMMRGSLRFKMMDLGNRIFYDMERSIFRKKSE